MIRVSPPLVSGCVKGVKVHLITKQKPENKNKSKSKNKNKTTAGLVLFSAERGSS